MKTKLFSIFALTLIIGQSLYAKDISRVTDYVVFKGVDNNAYICGKYSGGSFNTPVLYSEDIKSIPYSHYHHLLIDGNNDLYLIDPNNNSEMSLVATNVIAATSSPTRVYYSTNDRLVRYYDIVSKMTNHVVSGLPIVELAAGANHLVLRDSLNNVYTYGDNSYGQHGQRHFNRISGVKLLGKGYSVGASDNSTYWLATNNYIYGTGDNGYRHIRNEAVLAYNKPTISVPETDSMAVTLTSVTGHYRFETGSLRQMGEYDHLPQTATIVNVGSTYDLTDLNSGIAFISVMDTLTDAPVSYIDGEFVPTCELYEASSPITEPEDCKPGNGYGDKNHCHIHQKDR